MGRTAEGLQQRSNWNWRAIVIWLVIAAIVLVGGYYLVTKVFGWGQEKAPEALATVTMTSPSDSTVQQLYELRFQISDSRVAKKLKISVKGPQDEIKGDIEANGETGEVIWRPKETIMDPGYYTVEARGKGIEIFSSFFKIEKKEEQKKIEPTPTPTPAPAPTPQQKYPTQEEIDAKLKSLGL